MRTTTVGKIYSRNNFIEVFLLNIRNLNVKKIKNKYKNMTNLTTIIRVNT